MNAIEFTSAYNTKGSPKENYRDAFETDITDENCIYIRYENTTPCFMDRIRIYTDTEGKKIVEKMKTYNHWANRAKTDDSIDWIPINDKMPFQRLVN